MAVDEKIQRIVTLSKCQ